MWTRGGGCAPSTSSRSCSSAARTNTSAPTHRRPRSQSTIASASKQLQPVVHKHDFRAWRGDAPPPDEVDALAALVPSVRTVATPVLSAQKVFDRLYNAIHAKALAHFGAFYSSQLGGIVTNPAFMLVHMDDAMVHRAHAVFDTVAITDGYLYMLDAHLARFKRSAEAAGVELPMTDEELKRVVLDTAAASKKMNGIVKFWASPGRGGFGLTSSPLSNGGTGPTVYALATSENTGPIDRTEGLAACASPIAPKPAAIATIKGSNYLQNVLASSHAEDNGMDVGVFVDEEGFVLEGPNSNFGVVTQDNVFVTPPFDRAVAGVTIQALMRLIPETNAKFPTDVLITRIEQRRLHSDEVLGCKEAFLVDSGHLVTAVMSWNGQLVADGQPGVHAIAFANMLENDRLPREGSAAHTEVPYGYVTGMRGQLV